MPPPEPRSRTVCPAWSSISAVGLPQPRETATASSGRPLVSASEYKFDVMGSPHPHEVGPQHPPPLPTERAISPYFSRTAS
jgi:hypothetical protein